MINNANFTQPTSASVAKRIRALRKGRGWTLHDVEAQTHGSIKAVVMGSYERGARALSLTRAIEIANLFGIPIANLLGDFSRTDTTVSATLTIDQRRLIEIALAKPDARISALQSFISAISARRGDWNGEVLTLRATDFDTLTLIFEMTLPELHEWLTTNRLALISLK
jgi:transcriptional regulator with XRE-family HTH domain